MDIEKFLVEWLTHHTDPEDTATTMARRLLKDLNAAGYTIQRRRTFGKVGGLNRG